MASIRTMDSFLQNYSAPAWLEEKPQSFASALKEWQQIQSNYYMNDKAREALEEKAEKKEEEEKLKKKMRELGQTLDADDIQGSLRKVIDFSRGEGDINSAMSGIGRLYQLKEADKRRADADLRKAMGLSKKEQAKLEKEARKQKAIGYIRQGTNVYGFSPEAYRYAAGLAAENNDYESISEIGNSAKTFSSLWPKEQKSEDDEVKKLTNFANQNTNQNNNTGYEGQRAIGHKVGTVLRFDDGKVYQVGTDGNYHLLK